jgi:DNA-directed RNA polymerase sigma subunit (sigma70/sigma32)
MRGYEDYYSSPDSAIDLNAMLRDILAELERLNKRTDYLEAAVDSLINLPTPYQVAGGPASTDQSIAKLESMFQGPISIDQQIVHLQSEISTLDMLKEQTPIEDVIDRMSLESRRKQVLKEIVKLEEAGKP